jgi:hypothetical protein
MEYLLVNWRVKLVCLVVAALLWAALNNSVAPERDPRSALVGGDPQLDHGLRSEPAALPGSILVSPSTASLPTASAPPALKQGR